MSQRHLPPFAALRAFEAAARHLHFTRAAEELGITQAAVSRQIKALEAELGITLIRREATSNELTEPGMVLFTSLRDSLDRIAHTIRMISSRPERVILTVSVAPFFSSSWLTPRLMRFIKANPRIDLRLHHSYEPPDYRRDQIDLGVNWGPGKWTGVAAERLLDGSLTPLCSPEFLARSGEIRHPQDLIGKPLFYEFNPADWLGWFAASGMQLGQCPPATHLDDSHALRRMALDGHGVVLFFRSLVQADLASGRLVQPFSICVDTGAHYFISHPVNRELPSHARKFRRWLLAERDSIDL